MRIQSSIRDYDVLFSNTSSIFDQINDDLNTFYVIDSKVYDLYRETYFKSIPTERILVILAQEEAKTMDTVFLIIEKMIELPGKKNVKLVSFGGGIIQDITGFAAHILYRGINWVFFPTTLLAAADSCVGGKTSLNFKKYKNLLGTFFPPTKVIIESFFLNSLVEKDYLSGLGEVVKFNLMRGMEGLTNLERDLSQLLNRDSQTIHRYIESSLEFKKKFIEIDEFDQKERVLLNFAHTFGHAIETISHYKIPHGTAVAMGMIIANRISYKREILPQDYVTRSERILNQIINIESIDVKFDDLINAIKKDKKQTSDHIRAILLNESMDLTIFEDIQFEEIRYGFEFTSIKVN